MKLYINKCKITKKSVDKRSNKQLRIFSIVYLIKFIYNNSAASVVKLVDAMDSKESRVAKNAISKKPDIIELIEITPNEG